VTSALAVYLVLLVGVPAQLVVGPLGAAGSPAMLFGFGCFAWWFVARMDRRMGLAGGVQPLRWSAAIFGAVMLCSYVVAALRVTDYSELRSADRSFLRLLSWVGVMLLTADGIDSRAKLDLLLRRMAQAGGALAALGLVQFFLGIEIATFIKVPGLVANDAAQLIQERSSFRRVAGTASHPIEFGVVLSMLFPIALHCALHETERRRLHWVIVVAIGAAIPTSISRSAMLGAGAAWLMLFLGWDRRQRLNALIATPIALVVMRMAIPGLLGTLKSLFTGIANDPSYLGRTKDYEYVQRFIKDAPWLGRGWGTFIPDLYTTLDNQYLGQIVETGYLGLAALLLLLGSGVVLGWGVKRAAGGDDQQRSLGASLAASAVVPFVTFITFDGLAFSMVTGFAFLVLGCAGAARRLIWAPARQAGRPPRRQAPPDLGPG